jgi:hypothetical protein
VAAQMGDRQLGYLRVPAYAAAANAPKGRRSRGFEQGRAAYDTAEVLLR